MTWKRIHLFELEDLDGFPSILRTCMVNYLARLHELVGTSDVLAECWMKEIAEYRYTHILDCCSGNGELAMAVYQQLQERSVDMSMTLTDKFPQQTQILDGVTYRTNVHDLTQLSDWEIPTGTLLTINSAFHHFNPTQARQILQHVQEQRIPICIYEMSNNSQPKWLWWLALIPAMIGTVLLTPTLKKLSWQQLVFTYVIPILPICIAWDGAVSNARTYTREDLERLTKDLDDGYIWEIIEVSAKAPMPMLLLLGRGVSNPTNV